MPADDAKAGAPSAAPEEDGPSPDYLAVASLRFLVTCPHDPDAVGTKSKLLALVQKRSMAPFYKALCEKLGWAPEGFLAELEAANAAELAKLEEKIKDAAENETEGPTGSQQDDAGKRRHCPGRHAPAAFLNGIVHEWSCLAVTPQLAAGKTARATREADGYAPMQCNARRKTAQKRLPAFSFASQHRQAIE